MDSVINSIGESSRTRRKGPKTDDESEASDIERATKYTRSQREKINRIIKCHRDDYYGILDLSEDCSSKDISRAYRKLAVFIHPDKNPFGDATSAFDRIQRAYETLIDPKDRRRYDKTRSKHYKPDGEWDEGFHGNAYGEESGDDDESEDEEEEEGDQYPELPQSIKNIYDKAAPAVNEYLSDPTEENLDKIKKYNEAIKKINEKDGRAPFTYIIKYTFFETMLKELQPIAMRLDSNPSDIEALDKLHELVTNFEKMKQNYGYSSSWKIAIPDHIQERLEQRGKQSLKNDKRRKQNQESTLQLDSDIDMESQGSYQVSRSTWKPGETEKGERILGYRPFYKTDIISLEKNLMGLRFIIEQKHKDNPIALVSGADIGRQSVRAYMSLRESEKNDIRYSEKKWGIEDLDDFEEIIGAASMPFKNKAQSSNRIYPDGYFLVKMRSGKHIMNRQAVRKILGKTNADQRIAEFYVKVRETPPWEIEPLNWRSQRLLFDRPEIDGDRRNRGGMLKHHVADSDHELRLDQVRQQMRTKSDRRTPKIKDDSIDRFIDKVIADKLRMSYII